MSVEEFRARDLADVIAERDNQLRAQLTQAHAEAAAMRGALDRIRAVALEMEHHDCPRSDECDEAAWDADGETECAEHPDGDCPACSEECGRGLLLRLTDVRPGAGRAMLDRLEAAERSARAWQEKAMALMGALADLRAEVDDWGHADLICDRVSDCDESAECDDSDCDIPRPHVACTYHEHGGCPECECGKGAALAIVERALLVESTGAKPKDGGR